MVSVDRKYTEFNKAARGINGIGMIYMVWLYLIKFVTGCWVYNVYGRLYGIYRIIFHLYVIFMPNFLFFVGKFMNETFWRERNENKFN